MGEQVAYCVSGAECYLEFCRSESVGNVRGVFAYVTETDRFCFVVRGAACLDGLWVRCLWFNQKGIVKNVMNDV